MKERPILFSGPMVRALLAGTKTQTRRVVKPQPTHFNPAGVPRLAKPVGSSKVIQCPYGQHGDRLWVRETWQTFERGYNVYKAIPTRRPSDSCVLYAADDVDGDLGWRPSIHMPRWASRITLEITSVRVERLQDISEADAIAEGIERKEDGIGWKRGPISGDVPNTATRTGFPGLAYQSLWEQINGPGSWDANPWVWVIEFRRT